MTPDKPELDMTSLSTDVKTSSDLAAQSCAWIPKAFYRNSLSVIPLYQKLHKYILLAQRVRAYKTFV